jgi:hypothetical protein
MVELISKFCEELKFTDNLILIMFGITGLVLLWLVFSDLIKSSKLIKAEILKAEILKAETTKMEEN